MRFHTTAITLFFVMPGMLISLGAQTIPQSDSNIWQPVTAGQSSPLPLSPTASLDQAAPSISTSVLVLPFSLNLSADSFSASNLALTTSGYLGSQDINVTTPSDSKASENNDTEKIQPGYMSHPYAAAEVSPVPCGYMCRHRRELLPLLIGGAVFVEAADVYDRRETQIGLRHGVAVEGNTWLIGSHPSFRAGLARDQIMIGVSLIAPTLGWVKRWPLLFGGSLNEPYIVGIKHIRAGNAWRKLLGD